MKHFLTFTTLLGLLMLPLSVSSAAGDGTTAVTVNGSIVHEYRSDYNGPASPKIVGHKTMMTLDFKNKITDNFSLYARAGVENISNPTAKRAFADFAGGSNKGSLDAYGFEYKNGGVDYKVGLQPFTLGPTALLYDGTFAVGRHSLPLVANITGKIGDANLTAIAGRTNYYSGRNDRLYALQGDLPVNENASLGFVLAGTDYGENGSHRYSALSWKQSLGPKLTLTAECLKSDFTRDNTAYTVVASYDFDAKNSLLLADWRVELNASILDRRFWYMTTYLGDAAGQMLVWQHRITKDLSFVLVDMNFADLHASGFKGRRNSLRAKAVYNF